MEKIYSKVDPTLLLHIIVRLDEEFNQPGRIDLVPPEEFIQCSALTMDAEKTFRPHKHKVHAGVREVKAQESWVVLRGSVRCILYDIDDTVIEEPVLYAGDASFTLHGGHNYFILEDDTKVLEYKTGPYLGQYFDKEFL